MKTLFGNQSDTQSTHRAALAKAFATADTRLPQKESSAAFLATVLEPPLNQLLERRAEILRGLNADVALDALAAAQLAPDATAQQSSMPLDLPALEKEISIKRRAIQMQRDIVARTRMEWSAIVCQQLAPVHRQQVRRIAAALKELSDALRDHQELVDALRDNEVMNFTLHLRPMLLVRDTMQLRDESSAASLWMRDAEDAELLD